MAGTVVVGAGECGARVAFALRERGYDGAVTLVGAEPIGPYERPPLSKATLLASAPEPTPVASDADFAAAGVDLVVGTAVTAVDRARQHVTLSDERRLDYSHLVFATGARARPLHVPGGDHALLLRTLSDAAALRALLGPGRRLGVVGAGFVGLEVAAAASVIGCEVVVLESAPRVLGRAVPAPIADVVAARHRSAGVEVECGVSVVAIEPGPDGGRRIVLADGRAVDCDVVVAGIGAVPNTDLADAAGLKVDNGIAVDARLRTDDPAVLAAGDCCSFPHPLFGGRRLRPESWRNAIDQGAHVAGQIVGGDEPFRAVPWFWSDQYDLTLQICGLPDLAVDEVERRRPDGAVVRFGLDGDGRIVAASGIGVGSTVARDVRVAELLVAAGAHPDPAVLADAAANLKPLLKDHQ